MKASELAKALGGTLEGADVDLVSCGALEEARPGDLILTVGAGDVYRIGESLVSGA